MTDKITVCENQDEPYCFVSYSHEDMNKVLPVLSELTANGCRIWYDCQIESGTEWADYIHKWLTHKNCVKFIVFISKNSIDSDNVRDEVHIASKHKKSRLVIYLEDIDLTGGLELHLDRWQSIKWYEEEEDVFYRKMLKGIPAATIKIPETIYEGNSDFVKKYHIQEMIGRGGSGSIYKAKMLSTNSTVTIKIVDYALEAKTQVLTNERNTLLKLINCPFTPKLVDFGTDIINGETKSYLVESYIDGITLSNIRYQLSEADIVLILLKSIQILQYLHKDDNHLVHGDIKPENIMIDAYNNVYLIDFGSSVEELSKVRWGTTTFASPEINEGVPVDERSDIFSLGMTIKYLMIKEELQAHGIRFKDAGYLAFNKIAPNMSGVLKLIVEKMVDERIDKRFQSLDELMDVVEEYQNKLTERPAKIWEKQKENDLVVSVTEDSDILENNGLLHKLRQLFEKEESRSIGLEYPTERNYQCELRQLFEKSENHLMQLAHSAVLDFSVSMPEQGENSPILFEITEEW